MEGGQQKPASSMITFSRRRKEGLEAQEQRPTAGSSGSSGSSSAAGATAAAESACTSLTSYKTAPSVLTPLAEVRAPGDNASVSSTADSGPPAGKGGGGAARRRRRAPSLGHARAAATAQHMAELKAYFDEVDAFELTVETPTPKKGLPRPQPNAGASQPAGAGQAAGGAGATAAAERGEAVQAPAARAAATVAPAQAQSATKVRPMSLGLSRRSSIVALPRGLASARKSGRPSHLRASAFGLDPALSQHGGGEGGRPSNASLLLPNRRASAVADNMDGQGLQPAGPSANATQGQEQQQQGHRLPAGGRRSSVAAGRASISGPTVLSRLSLGLSDALHWLGIRGSLPAAASQQQQQQPALPEEEPAAAAAAAPGGGRRSSMAAAVLAARAGGDMSPITEEAEAGSSPAPPTPACPTIDESCEADTPQTAGPAAATPAFTAATQPLQEAATPALALDASASPSAAVEAEGAAAACAEAEGAAAAASSSVAQGTEEAVAELQQELEAKLALSEALPEPQAEAEPAAAAAAVEEEEEEEGEELTPLQQLLTMCGQELDPAALPSMDALLGQHVDLGKVKKIGEGTFGEAFKAGGVVFKIVPMDGEVLVNGEVQKRSDEILAEAAITLTLSGLRGTPPGASPGAPPPANATAGFVETFGVGVCRGCYAAALRKEWHRWDKQFGSENDPVDIFGDGQLFVVFVVADGGLDLEHYELRSFKELRSILLQVCLTLAVAEEGCEFEHRDLHWGNLLIQRDGSEEVECRLRGSQIRAATAGVTVTLIDFTLSRLLTAGGEAVFCNLAADPEIFKGPKGDVQAETYRRMRKATRDCWERFVPATNCLWMHYLADICLAQKLEGVSIAPSDRHELRAFRKRALGYGSTAELLFDDFFSGAWLCVPPAAS